jgi:shikimate dehydrogenase
MDISGNTRICAIIGDPIGHTISPPMHNAAFAKLGLDYVYIPFRVAPEELPKAVAGMRALNVAGFNVTIPHKVAVLPLLDVLDPLAARIEAVNTVINVGGRLTGYNTDAEGFLRALQANGIDPAGKKIAVLGAGGASRAVSYILVQNGAELTVYNRASGLVRAASVAYMIQQGLGKTIKVLPLDDLPAGIKGVDILVNATSVGMFPSSAETPVPAGLLPSVPVVIDVVYSPVETRLIKEAKKAGVKTLGGLDMLVWQGALAFEKWTGRPAPLKVMRCEALKALKKHNMSSTK